MLPWVQLQLCPSLSLHSRETLRDQGHSQGKPDEPGLKLVPTNLYFWRNLTLLLPPALHRTGLTSSLTLWLSPACKDKSF